ncbi:MAG TPA: endonuclease/exonuclease/phosphatase family protein [Frankiaceae bacterium]|nr:endonuclease/exonuclease/phosphatase family protein [Frankiaceae bacterium]
MTRLRVLSYNVLSLRLGTDRVAAVIRACDPDVVCVQEAPRFFGWRRKCRALADAAGLRLVTGGRPAGAVLLLARPSLRVVTTRDVKLPWHPPLHRRGLAIAVLDAGGREVVFASMHLSLDDAERRAQVDLTLRDLAALAEPAAPAALDRPVVLAGDVNETPDDESWQVLAEALQDAYAVAPRGDGLTMSAATPRRRIDAVFVDRRLRVVSCGVPDVAGLAEASDHRPVLATLEIT